MRYSVLPFLEKGICRLLGLSNLTPYSACEFDNLPLVPYKEAIDTFKHAAQFVIDQVIASEEMLSKMAGASTGDDDWAGSYFELKTTTPLFKV